MRRVRRLLQIAAALVIAAGVAYLFVRSARNTRSEPYTVNPGHLRGWTLALEPAPAATGAVVVLRPPQPLAPQLFQQVFARAMESLNAPATPHMPLILHREFAQAFAGRVTPDALLTAARAAGLESTTFEPDCLAHRRVSEPGVSRQLYFAVFRSPAFQQFRGRAAALLDGTAGGNAFDPSALSPVLFIGASDPAFSRWLPLRTDPQRDCVAPIVTSH